MPWGKQEIQECIINRDLKSEVDVIKAIIFMDMSYAFFFLALTGQMLISSKLADMQDYLKTQFGYPYFQENMIIKQYHTSEYVPEHKINFRNNGMDEL